LNGDADVARIAGLIGDDTRAAMLLALLGGGSLAAGELARSAHVTPQTASSHLAKLVGGGLLDVEARGRSRRYAIAGPDVAHAIEAIAAIAPLRPARALSQSVRHAALKTARTCYDHLAGKLAVALLAALVDRHALRPLALGEGRAARRGPAFGTALLGPAASAVFAECRIDVAALESSGRQFAPLCLDWTERTPHLGGALGAALCGAFLRNDWCRRAPVGRALVITPTGRRVLDDRFGVRL
jgi:DNA-binding transcriptional ArsR family regulator